jgi:hypothetical protein
MSRECCGKNFMFIGCSMTEFLIYLARRLINSFKCFIIKNKDVKMENVVPSPCV